MCAVYAGCQKSLPEQLQCVPWLLPDNLKQVILAIIQKLLDTLNYTFTFTLDNIKKATDVVCRRLDVDISELSLDKKLTMILVSAEWWQDER